ncbi:MAG: hypothetical protein HFF63_10860 [Oscillospiraceae bacterium]|nr:hypothetical protein [Oscillospiraceae bacterium]
MDEIPDVTIEEMREKLNLSASYSIVDRAIAAMGYTVKKKSLCASERGRVRCAGKAQRMESDHCKENKDKRVEARLKALELRSKGAKAHEVAAAGFHAAYVTQLVAKYRNNGLRVCLKSFDKREREADNREKQAGVGENASISK